MWVNLRVLSLQLRILTTAGSWMIRRQAGDLSDTGGLKEVNFYPVPHVKEEPFVGSAQATMDTYGK